jgi:hypothetical protein
MHAIWYNYAHPSYNNWAVKNVLNYARDNFKFNIPQINSNKLGPLLYILYANDIAKIFSLAKIKMYADDITMYAIINNEDDRLKLQTELNYLLKWANV